MSSTPNVPPRVAVIGGGPAGLMAAEQLAAAGGVGVDLYDTMPSVGRKFLLAGKGGLNLTHAEPFDRFITRYAARRPQIEPLLRRFDADALRAWAATLGVSTFVGSSQRVFPADMKAAPLLRAWLHRLRAQGVQLHMRHRWLGWDDDDHGHDHGALRFATPTGPVAVRPAATVLALGGGSWPRLGSDGAWQTLLAEQGIDVAPLQPANCGFDVTWSPHFRTRHAGAPVKSVAITFIDSAGNRVRQPGEFVVTQTGVEGSLIYAASGPLRDQIAAQASAPLELDLLPDLPLDKVQAELARSRGSRSLSTHLKSRLKLSAVKIGLLHETLLHEAQHPRETLNDAALLAAHIKALRITLTAPRPLDEAISSAGGVTFEALDDHLMFDSTAWCVLRRRDARLGSAHRRLPADRVFCDWARCGAGGVGVVGAAAGMTDPTRTRPSRGRA